jgi:hypothetical protein
MSHSLTDISTRSAVPAVPGSSVVFTLGMWMSPCARVLDREAALAQRREMRAARDESHVAPGTGEPAP